MGHCNCSGHGCSAHDREEQRKTAFQMYGGAIFSFLMLMGGIAIHALDVPFFRSGFLPFIWYLAAYLPVGLPVMKEAWESIREGELFSEFTLMAIATLGAFYIGEYPEGVAVMLFYTVGELFQNRAVDKAKRNIEALLDVRPERVVVIRAGQPIVEAPRNVAVGEIIEIKAGERVPLDGALLDEIAAFNTAALTGESMPRDIRRDEEVLAGMVLTDRVIRLRVSRPFEQSALARILELVRNASERKAPAELFIRRFARIYTPVVTSLAVLIVLLPWLYSLIDPTFIFLFNEWLYRALVFLVISCPCALVVSIPLGYFGGIGAASRRGILFKGGNYLDAITQINTVVFDKTGTLTQGAFEVLECRPAEGLSEAELLQIIASVERNSNHPIAGAIVNQATLQQLTGLPVDDVKELAGYGLEAQVDGKRVCVGSIRLLVKENIAFPDELAQSVDTLVVAAVDNRYVGYIRLADALKEDARRAIEDLKALQINRICILSGDKQEIVTRLAAELGIPEGYGDLLPEGKVKQIEHLRQDPANRIVFVGDGMNDAPVLALSHVGIAMGGLGSDAAIETADVVIQTDQPSKVAVAVRIGKLTRRVIRQNIALAFGVKLLVLLLGAAGVATLWEAVFADVGVALLAIVNAVRIQRMVK